MHLRIISFIACVGSIFLGMSTQAAYSEISLPTNRLSANLPSQPKSLSLNQIRDRAQSITVKVLAGQSWGSGILIKKQGQIYTVLTNAHVLRLGDTYRIQTPDGRIYSGSKVATTDFDDNDLALLNFRSNSSYKLATLDGSSSFVVGDELFAAGFPADGNAAKEKGFVFKTGKVSVLLPQAFLGGYQVGYSNDIVKGMSGGPVLNRYGNVVAINGKHNHPLWGNTYIFKDGSTAVAQVRKQWDKSSWAVPVKTFLQLAPRFVSSTLVAPEPIEYPTQIEEPTTISPQPEASPVESSTPRIDASNQKPRSNSFW